MYKNLNILAKDVFGMDATTAKEQHICVNCKCKISHENVFTVAGEREYQISGLCEICYDKIMDVNNE